MVASNSSISDASFIAQAWAIGRTDPIWWLENVLNMVTYEKSRELIGSVPIYDDIVLPSGHTVSKSYTLDGLAIWWATVIKGRAIITGPKFEQVKKIHFGNIRRILNNSRIPGSATTRHGPNSSQWVVDPNVDAEIIVINSSPEQSTNVSGYHHDRILLIIDEAAGVDDRLIEAFEATMSGVGTPNTLAKRIMAGNPIEQTGCTEFRKACTLPNSKWHKIHISSYDSPNVTGEKVIPGLATDQWIKKMEHKWGKDSMFFKTRILGEFWDEGATDRLISDTLINEASAPNKKPAILTIMVRGQKVHRHSCAQGVDIARYGDDFTVSYILKDGKVEDVAWRGGMDEVQCAAWIAERGAAFGVIHTELDTTGLGVGVYDILRSRYPNISVRGVNFSQRANKADAYKNVRTEMAFMWRDALRDGIVVLDTKTPVELYDDMRATTYKVLTGGMVQLTAKDEIKKTLGRSPDHFDAAMLAYRAYLHTRQLSPEEDATIKLQHALHKMEPEMVGGTF